MGKWVVPDRPCPRRRSLRDLVYIKKDEKRGRLRLPPFILKWWEKPVHHFFNFPLFIVNVFIAVPLINWLDQYNTSSFVPANYYWLLLLVTSVLYVVGFILPQVLTNKFLGRGGG